jgi:hypothetical protein
MFKNIETHNFNSSDKGVFVMHSSQPVSEYKPQKFVAAVLMAAFMGVLSLQAGFVLNASASDNPISSPISGPITAPSNNTQNNGGTPSNGGGGSSSNSGGSAASCNNEAPKAPKIVSAITTGKNEITLTWEKPQGNVTHYSIAYGLLAGKPLYGNPNIGNVSSFTVKQLAGGVNYFFIVKAVNGCTPSMASNEIAIKIGGKFINAPAQGFQAGGVLGKAIRPGKIEPKSSIAPIASIAPVVSEVNNPQPNLGLVGKVLNFFKGFFKP